MKKIDGFWGCDIETAIANAIQAAANEPGEFEFNGVTVQVESDSDPALIYRDWERGMLRPSGTFTVSPHPQVELSKSELDEDARLRREHERREQEASAAYERKRLIAAGVLEDLLRGAPPLALKDAEGWQKSCDINKDGYGGAVMRFAENWARLMQLKISQGDKLADVADECCSIADGPEGITGFIYGCAVGILSQVWLYGEDLRRWHNLKTQIGDEGERANESGGVLNPALLTIGK